MLRFPIKEFNNFVIQKKYSKDLKISTITYNYGREVIKFSCFILSLYFISNQNMISTKKKIFDYFAFMYGDQRYLFL